MIGDAGQHFAQIGLGIETGQLRRTDQAVDHGRAFSACIRSGKQVILPAQGHAAQRSFGGVIVDLDVSIFYIARRRVPAGEAVANRQRGLIAEEAARVWGVQRQTEETVGADLGSDVNAAFHVQFASTPGAFSEPLAMEAPPHYPLIIVTAIIPISRSMARRSPLSSVIEFLRSDFGVHS